MLAGTGRTPNERGQGRPPGSLPERAVLGNRRRGRLRVGPHPCPAGDQAVAGSLPLSGSRGRLLSLRSSRPGERGSLAALDAALTRFADVEGGANAGPAPLAAQPSSGSGNNDVWVLP